MIYAIARQESGKKCLYLSGFAEFAWTGFAEFACLALQFALHEYSKFVVG